MTGVQPKRDWSALMFTAEQLEAEAQEQRRGRRRVLARTGAAAAAAVVAVAGVGVWAGEQVGHPTPSRAAITTSASTTAAPVTRFITSVSLAPPIVRTVRSTVLVTITKPAINTVTVTVTAKAQPSSAHAAPAATRKANPVPTPTTRRAYPTPAPAAAATPTQTASVPTRATR